MLIGFIGCPCSGKTTTAALTFADLKTMGLATEFIPEQARYFIAEKRLQLGQDQGTPVQLYDEDQVEILMRQITHETTLLKSSSPETIIVTDTAALCTLLYMGAGTRDTFDERVRRHVHNYDLLFHCGPVKMPSSLDSNRVHSEAQSLLIDQEIPKLLAAFGVQPIYLAGDHKQRHHEVTRTILERFIS